MTPRNALNCASLIGPTLRAETEAAALPEENTIGGWVSFGDAQTGRLEVAEAKRKAVIEITDGCQAAQADLSRPWWKAW